MNGSSDTGGRQLLIDATLMLLGERGYHGSSLRTNAETACVTTGLVKREFSEKDEPTPIRHGNRRGVSHEQDS